MPGLDLIVRKYPATFQEKLIIALDCSHLNRIRDLEKLPINVPVLNIDHTDNSYFGTDNMGYFIRWRNDGPYLSKLIGFRQRYRNMPLFSDCF